MQNDVIVFLTCLICFVNCDVDPTFMFEQQNDIGKNRLPENNYRRAVAHDKVFDLGLHGNGHPAPLPSPAPAIIHPSPYEKIYQGKRRQGFDKRVYNEKFEREPNALGQVMSSSMLFDCILSHLAVETDLGIPILLRGGVGYRFFNIIVRAKPGVPLVGRIKAYCLKTQNDLDEAQKKAETS